MSCDPTFYVSPHPEADKAEGQIGILKKNLVLLNKTNKQHFKPIDDRKKT